MTTHMGAAEIDEPLDEMKTIDFEVLAYKHQFFSGWSWRPHQIVLEESVDGEFNFWSVSVFTREDFQK